MTAPIIKDEKYWFSKHPLTEQLYDGRPIPGTSKSMLWDVRRFLSKTDSLLEKVVLQNDMRLPSIEDSVLSCQRWVTKCLTYISDDSLGIPEYWMFPNETLYRTKADCEDGALLMASLLYQVLPLAEHWRVRVNAGYVQAGATAPMGGHAYVVFCRPKDNEWVILDWCYLEDSKISVNDKVLARDNSYYKDIWFSFSYDYAWAHTKFDLRGRVRLCGKQDRESNHG